MKVVGVIAQIFFFLLLLAEAGCGPAAPGLPPHNRSNLLSAYAPVKIDIMPLTEFIGVGEPEEVPRINVYVSLLDSFGCQKKSPGVFRFELYKHVERSADEKGRRITIWPDIDLTDVVENNNHWRDFVRAYEFNLGFEPQSNQSYVLQATCMCPSGRRLSAEFAIKHTK
ncbi:hypothetical protein ES703_33590 [subsurface metagenome]